MSAFEIRDAIVEKIENDSPDFICLNFANPDMVGHTGNLEAAIKACEAVDQCVADVLNTALKKDYAILSDIAPTILDLLKVDIPKAMDRNSLLVKK